MSRRALAGLGTTLAALALVASCSTAGQPEGSQAGRPGGEPSEAATTSPPAPPLVLGGPYVIVNTPTGPIVVPREMAAAVARQYGGTERDIYEPGTYRGQRHSNDSGGR